MLEFVEFFNVIIKDNKITVEEYEDWMNKFTAREILDIQVFQKYVDDFKKPILEK